MWHVAGLLHHWAPPLQLIAELERELAGQGDVDYVRKL
jgi:hypothetical protein